METKRLIGRPLTEADIPFVMKVWNDERVTALILETMSEQQVRDRIERWSRHRAEHDCGTELFFDRSSAQPIGWGGLQHSTIGIGESLTIGYAVAPDMWGRGYATEIARTPDLRTSTPTDRVASCFARCGACGNSSAEESVLAIAGSVRASDRLQQA